jgi:hypothetical protein
MRLQNDIQQTIVQSVKQNTYSTNQDILNYFKEFLMYTTSSPTIKSWIYEKVELEIQKLLEWSIIYEVEEKGIPSGYYQTDWTDDQINLFSMYK